MFCFYPDALHQQPPTFLAPGTGFVEDNFSMAGGGGAADMVQAVMRAMGSDGSSR